jgi:hypothetical protein
VLGTLRTPSSQSTWTSLVALIGAAVLAIAVFCPPQWREQGVSRAPDRPRPVSADILAAFPEEPLLAERLASQWTTVAGEIARVEGSDGLRTLDLFGSEAADLFVGNPPGFHDLTAIARLA